MTTEFDSWVDGIIGDYRDSWGKTQAEKKAAAFAALTERQQGANNVTSLMVALKAALLYEVTLEELGLSETQFEEIEMEYSQRPSGENSPQN